MSSTDDLLADLEDDDAGGSSADRQERGEQQRRGLRGRLGSRLGSLFSLRAFLVALALSAAGTFVASVVPFVPASVVALLGVFVGTFLLGLADSTRRYAECAVAGAGVVAVVTLLDWVLISVLAGLGPPVAVVSGSAGLLAGLLGHYFGRDLRAGVTRDL